MSGHNIQIDVEDPNQPLLGFCTRVLILTGLFPSKSKLLNSLNVMNWASISILTLTQIIETCRLRTDVNPFLTNLKFACIGFVTCSKVNTFFIWQSEWKDTFRYIIQADDEERAHKDRRMEIVERYTKYCRNLVSVYWVITAFTAVGTIFLPVMTYIFTPGYGERMREGSLPFPHIFKAWVPFDKETSPGCWFVVCWYIHVCIYGGVGIGIYDTSILVIMVFVENKFELLKHRCSLIYCEHEGLLSDGEFHARIQRCHRIHVLLMKHTKILNSLLSPVMFIYVVVCSMFLCTGLIQVTLETTTAEKILNIQFVAFGVVQLFVYCFYSNKVFIKSTEVSYGCYNNSWYELDASKQRMVMLLAYQLRKTVVFTAGPFTNLTLSTFTTIIKGSYSYYALLRE